MKTLKFGNPQGLAKTFWLANALFAATLALSLWYSYHETMQNGRARTQSLSLIVGKSVTGLLDQTDLLVLAMANTLTQSIKAGKMDAAAMNEVAEQLGRSVPHLTRLSYTDAEGNIAANTGYPRIGQGANIADREYFRQLRATPDAGLVISKPLIGRVRNKQVVIFARAYTNAQGHFQGIAYVSVELAALSDLFAKLQLDTDASVGLLSNDDYLVLARYPAHKDPLMLGKRIQMESFVRAMQQGQPVVGMVDTSKVDGIQRVYSLRKLDRWPYFVGLGLSTDALLAPWYRQLLAGIGTLFLFFGLTGSAVWQARRGWQRQEDALATLRATLEATDNGILVLSAKHEVLHLNQRFVQLWQVPPPCCTAKTTRRC